MKFSDYEEFDEEIEMDEVDGEFTPLTYGIDDGFLVPPNGNPKKNGVDVSSRTDPNPKRRVVPSGYFPQWPSYYPEVRNEKLKSSEKC